MKESIAPNSTQTPNILFDEWMPILSGLEFKIAMLVTRQTLGWVEDVETGRRKEKDWISHSQLVLRTGGSRRAITTALKALLDQHCLIEAYDSQGHALDSPSKRRKIGVRIYYRLNLHAPPPTLFGTIANFAMVQPKKKTVNKVWKRQPTIANFAQVP